SPGMAPLASWAAARARSRPDFVLRSSRHQGGLPAWRQLLSRQTCGLRGLYGPEPHHGQVLARTHRCFSELCWTLPDPTLRRLSLMLKILSAVRLDSHLKGCG